MPSLRELDAHLFKYVPRPPTPEERALNPSYPAAHVIDCMEWVDPFPGSHGLWFDCPKCFAENKGPVGTHGVRVFFAGSPVPDRLGQNKDGRAVRWQASGSGLDDLVLTPSIQLQGGCNWHGFVGSSGVPPGHAA